MVKVHAPCTFRKISETLCCFVFCVGITINHPFHSWPLPLSSTYSQFPYNRTSGDVDMYINNKKETLVTLSNHRVL